MTPALRRLGESPLAVSPFALGSWRTYAQMPAGQSLDYAAWTEAIRAGRTFVTAGPIIKTTIGDKPTLEIVDFVKNTLAQ